MSKALPLIILLTYAIGINGLHAQDGHYWTQQYGTKSMLLSGSVIGGVDDLGAVYYNPGRLAIIKNPAFLLSASVYEYNSLSATDDFGSKQSASKSEIRGVPTLAAGTFKLKFLPNHFFAYAVMTRQLADVSTSFKNDVLTEVFTNIPGDEYFSGELIITNRSNEQWMGLTWSHPISKKISIGVTTNFVTNTQTKGSSIELRALTQADSVGIYQYRRGFDYKETGLLWKIGAAGSFGLWDLGLTVKTPMLRLSGDGSYNYLEFFATMPGLKNQTPIYTISNQEGLEAKTQSPWAIGFGASRAIGKNKLHLSTEWYSGVSKYTVMSAVDHTSQSNPTQNLAFVLTDQMKSVFNAGLGVEFYISTHIKGFGSFSTDFSSVSDDITRFIQRQTEAANSSWKADFYNIGGGVVLDFKGADITLGVTHTGARQTIPRIVNFPDGSGGDIFDPNQTMDLKWDRYRFVFSFSFPFLADYAKKLEGGEKK